MDQQKQCKPVAPSTFTTAERGVFVNPNRQCLRMNVPITTILDLNYLYGFYMLIKPAFPATCSDAIWGVFVKHAIPETSNTADWGVSVNPNTMTLE